jgi:hypothetical protein
MRIGFTGTQKGMTEDQKKTFRLTLSSILKGDASFLSLHSTLNPSARHEFHHGDCIGADAGAAAIARELGCEIIAWPSDIPNKRAYFPSDVIHIEGLPLIRNHIIVETTEVLIAAPETVEEKLRSGTWATVRYARKLKKPLEMIWP